MWELVAAGFARPWLPAAGFSQNRLMKNSMPTHKEVTDFAERISETSRLKIVDEKQESRVVLMMKKDRKDRVMSF